MIETFTFVMGLVRVNYARSSKLFQLLHHYIQDLLLQAQNPVPTTILHKELNIKEQKWPHAQTQQEFIKQTQKDLYT